jgi:hypothetical protein
MSDCINPTERLWVPVLFFNEVSFHFWSYARTTKSEVWTKLFRELGHILAPGRQRDAAVAYMRRNGVRLVEARATVLPLPTLTGEQER